MRSSRNPRHRNDPVSGVRRARGRAKGAIGGGLGIAAALVISLGATGGTYAYLSDTSDVTEGATLRAGTAELAVTGSPISLTGFYPGLTQYRAVTVTNTGTTPLALSVDALARTSAANAFSNSLTVGIATTATAAACTGGTVASVWSAALGSAAPAGALGYTLAPGASRVVCVATTMANTAPLSAASLAATYTVTLGGTQP